MTPENQKKVQAIKKLLETISGKKIKIKEMVQKQDMSVDDSGNLLVDEYITDKEEEQ